MKQQQEYTTRLGQQSGFVMPILLFTVAFIMLMITVVASFSLTTYNLASRERFKVNAQLAADAGLDASINELNIDPNWLNSGGEITLLDSPKLRTTYETELLDGIEDNQKVLSVVAKAYAPASATDPTITRRYELDLQAVTSGNNITSVVSGVGGLVLSSNAKITGGDVVVNGNIVMSNQSQIGTQTNAVNVRVAHQSCPVPATASYPQLCTSGQPMNLSTNARIYAEVHANNQTDGTNMSNPGLIVGQPVAPVELPDYDRSIHAAATEYAANHAAVNCPNNGSVTWGDNIKINGSVSLGNNCRVTITGNVWITGSLDTGNNGEIYISDGLSTTRPVIMVDGQNGFRLDNNGEVIPNSSGTGFELRTFWSHSTSGCSPNCTNLTGAGLANSQNITTIDLGNNGNAANSVFIAQWSRVRVSNNGALGAVAGQSIELANQAVINFTASVPGSTNLTQTWVKRGYIRVFD